MNIVEHDVRKISASGKSKGYCVTTIPHLWREVKPRDEIHAFFSSVSKGYLLIVTDNVYKQKLEASNLEMSLERSKLIVDDVARSTQIENRYLEDVLEDLVRFNLMSAVTHGYSKATIKFDIDDKETMSSLFLKFLNMENSLNNMSLLDGKKIFEIKLDNVKKEMSVEIANAGVSEPFEYDYYNLTEIMLSHHASLFDKAADCIRHDINQNRYQDMVDAEGALDFLWFYYLRQLKKGIDVGYFSGLEKTGTHAVCLSMLSKMLEQNADSLMRVVSLLDYLKKKATEDHATEFLEVEFKDFLQKINKLLTAMGVQCKALIKTLPGAIDSATASAERIEEIYESVTETISNYHGVLAGQIGKISEAYVTQRKEKSMQDLSSTIFGEYEEFAASVEQKYGGKGYSFIISQIVAELRRLAKFPRNIAVICIVIMTPIIEKKYRLKFAQTRSA